MTHFELISIFGPLSTRVISIVVWDGHNFLGNDAVMFAVLGATASEQANRETCQSISDGEGVGLVRWEALLLQPLDGPFLKIRQW
jgi:hypothetical protein